MEKSDTCACTPEELLDIITFPCGGLTMLPDTACDHVHPNIIISEEGIARNISVLRRLKVTHVLNAAHGPQEFQVNTDPATYTKARIKFLGVDAMDFQNFQLAPFFEEAAEFISDAVKSGGQVLVHCRQGISRSATLVLAYLMLKEGMRARDAVRAVRDKRNICPNDGFLQQICDLDQQLLQKGHFNNLPDLAEGKSNANIEVENKGGQGQ
ncbi:dual specificity protein phosphatase 3-like [Liolophura sinensis]|uniref:dual specificity protein phosphatase 3-like n=1 Tax=Liolophura sinensis TaxID=3198878 RepID=UPI003158437F